MTPEQKERNREWVKDLRSGKFTQIQKRLADSFEEGTGRCCLGVACETFQRLTEAEHGSPVYGGVPNDPVRDFFGWDGNNPILGDRAASNQNDYQGKSFDEIADLIEQEFGLVEVTP